MNKFIAAVILLLLSIHEPAAQIMSPGGRLVAASGNCSGAPSVQTADLLAADFVCYVAHATNNVPISGQNYTFSSPLQLYLSATSATQIFDVYVAVVGGNVTLCLGGTPWINSTTPGVVVVKTAHGYWTNASPQNCYSGASNLGVISAGAGTYVGSVYAVSAGHTAWVLSPSPNWGGTANVLGVYNAYNQEPVIAIERELTSNWYYNAGVWRPVNGSSNNKITTLDGLGTSVQRITTWMTIDAGANCSPSAPCGGTTNVCVDCNVPGAVLQVSNQAGLERPAQGQTLGSDGYFRGRGLHTFTHIEIGGGGCTAAACTEWFGNTYSGMLLEMKN